MSKLYLLGFVLPFAIAANFQNSPYLTGSTRVLFPGGGSNKPSRVKEKSNRSRSGSVDKENCSEDLARSQSDGVGYTYQVALAFCNKALRAGLGSDNYNENLIKAYKALVGLFKQNEKDGRYPDQNSIDLFMKLRDMSTCIVTKVDRPERKKVVFNQPGDDLSCSPRSRISFAVTPPGAETSLTPVTPSPAAVKISRAVRRVSAARSLNFESNGNSSPSINNYKANIYWGIEERLNILRIKTKSQDSVLNALTLAPLA